MATPEPLSSEEAEVLTACWEHFKEKRSWPSNKQLARQFPQWGKVFLGTEEKWSRIRVSDRVTADWFTLQLLPEVRQLLGPLPAFFRQVAAWFIESPIYVSDPQSSQSVGFQVFQKLWGDETRARLAAHLLVALKAPLGDWYSGRDDVWLKPTVEALRYESVQTLEDIQRIEVASPVSDDNVKKFAKPVGSHLELLRRLHHTLMKEGTWPASVPFAIAERRLGYIPEMVAALAPRFIRSPFSALRVSTIELKTETLPLVASEDELRLLTQVIGAIGRLWLDKNEHEIQISVEDIACDLDRLTDELRPLVRYLEGEPWSRGGSFGSSVSDPWHIRVGNEISWFKEVKTWQEYVGAKDARLEENQRSAAAFQASMQLHPEMARLFPVGPFAPSAEMVGAGKSRKKRGIKAQSKRLFISHAEVDVDKEIVNAFCDLLEFGIGIPHDEIVCTSREHQAVPPGTKFRDFLRSSINECFVFICLVSSNYYASSFSLCELGAAWGSEKKIIPVVVPPLGLKDLKGVLEEGWQGTELLNEGTLTRLYDHLRSEFRLAPDASRWSQRLRKYIQDVERVFDLQSRYLVAPAVAAAQTSEKPALEIHSGVVPLPATTVPLRTQPIAPVTPHAPGVPSHDLPSDSDEWREFTRRVEAVKQVAGPLAPLLRAATYGASLDRMIQWGSGIRDEIEDAVDRGMLVGDDEGYYQANIKSEKMKRAIKPFNDLRAFLTKTSNEFHFEHETRYGCLAQMDNHWFAMTHIGFTWKYSLDGPDSGDNEAPF